MNAQSPVVLFDGECNLCNGFVNFLLRYDRKEVFRFASLQSDIAKSLVGTRLGDNPIDADTVVLVEGDAIFLRSDAALRIAALLPWPWRAAKVLTLVPRPIRDFAYRVVARYRKRIFRKKVTCRLPTADERRRLL
jgi:predicted DCC family thiol-disulfide oxidoreductase YuxK